MQDVFARASVAAQALELRLSLRRRVPREPLPKLLEELTPRPLPPVSIPLAELWLPLRLVEAVCRRMRFFPDTCLYRALTRYSVLRRAGHAAKFVMGMDPRPRADLTAHAWVEMNGAPYRETLDPRMVVTYVYPE